MVAVVPANDRAAARSGVAASRSTTTSAVARVHVRLTTAAMATLVMALCCWATGSSSATGQYPQPTVDLESIPVDPDSMVCPPESLSNMRLLMETRFDSLSADKLADLSKGTPPRRPRRCSTRTSRCCASFCRRQRRHHRTAARSQPRPTLLSFGRLTDRIERPLLRAVAGLS